MTYTAEDYTRIAELLGDLASGKQYRVTLKSESWRTISAALHVAARVAEPGVIERSLVNGLRATGADNQFVVDAIRTALQKDAT